MWKPQTEAINNPPLPVVVFEEEMLSDKQIKSGLAEAENIPNTSISLMHRINSIMLQQNQ